MVFSVPLARKFLNVPGVPRRQLLDTLGIWVLKPAQPILKVAGIVKCGENFLQVPVLVLCTRTRTLLCNREHHSRLGDDGHPAERGWMALSFGT